MNLLKRHCATVLALCAGVLLGVSVGAQQPSSVHPAPQPSAANWRTVPVGLEDVSKFPALFAELARRGWAERELRLLAGENILRVMRRAEEVAARLSRARGGIRQ